MRSLDVVALAACACLVSLPCEAQTGSALSQADLAKIEGVYRAYEKAALSPDRATVVASFYLDDGVRNPPNAPAVNGRAAIKTWLEKFPPITEFTVTNVKVDGCRDLAYALGTYTLAVAPPGAPGPVKDSGKYVTILRRQPDGKWYIALDIWNSDLPATPSAK